MPLDPPVTTATLPASFPMIFPFVCPTASLTAVSTLKWVKLRQSLSADARTSVVRNQTRYADRSRQGVRIGLDRRDGEAYAAVRDCSMIDWDDVRFFLAVARGGSVRAAAERLGVNHTTVLRRIAQLEARLGALMFEKLPAGYRLTSAGEEVLEFAAQMEASSTRLESRVFGRDQGVRGLLRVTLAPTLAAHLLMPDIAEFARLHPE